MLAVLDAAGGLAVVFALAGAVVAGAAFAFDSGAVVVVVVLGGAVTGTVAVLLFVAGAAGAAGCGALSGCDCRTERVPRIEGNPSARAQSMKRAAAPMVILARSVCVPRGPNAVLETLLEKSAPASDLPGCSSTATTRTIQARIKRPYKV